VSGALSFVTPYAGGREFMTIHLRSIRQFHPTAPILVSKKGGGRDEMEAHREAFGLEYWLEECTYLDALLRLLKRCETEFVCVLDHDTVLLSTLDSYVEGLRANRYDLVGVEERIREPAGAPWQRYAPEFDGWFRLAPGHVDFSLVMFNLHQFVAQWGLRGIVGGRPRATKDYEFIYGVSQHLARHKYLLPYHTGRYGLGNLLVDGDARVAWHQWYASYQSRLPDDAPAGIASGLAERVALIERGQHAFLQDYPRLELSPLEPAWGPGRDVVADGAAIARRRAGAVRRAAQRVRGWWRLGAREMAARGWNRLERLRLLR
jgi:hypothetical protein